MAHKPSEVTRRTVSNASGLGVSQNHIAVLLDISEKTLRRRYRKELNSGKANSNVAVAQMIYKRCLAGSDSMLRFWALTQMGWSENRRVELSGPAGQPLEHRHTYGNTEILDEFYRRGADAERAISTLEPAGGGEHLGAGDAPGDES